MSEAQDPLFCVHAFGTRYGQSILLGGGRQPAAVPGGKGYDLPAELPYGEVRRRGEGYPEATGDTASVVHHILQTPRLERVHEAGEGARCAVK